MCKVLLSTCPSGSAAALRIQILNHMEFGMLQLCTEHTEPCMAFFGDEITDRDLYWAAFTARRGNTVCVDMEVHHQYEHGACQRCDEHVVAHNWRGMVVSDMATQILRKPVGSSTSSSPSSSRSPSSFPSPPPRRAANPDALQGWVQQSYRREYINTNIERPTPSITTSVERRSVPTRPRMPGTFPQQILRNDNDEEVDYKTQRRSRSPSWHPTSPPPLPPRSLPSQHQAEQTTPPRSQQPRHHTPSYSPCSQPDPTPLSPRHYIQAGPSPPLGPTPSPQPTTPPRRRYISSSPPQQPPPPPTANWLARADHQDQLIRALTARLNDQEDTVRRQEECMRRMQRVIEDGERERERKRKREAEEEEERRSGMWWE